MSLSTNKALVKSFVEEVFNKHDISAAEKYFAEEQPPIGIEEFKKILSDQFEAFPVLQTKIEHIVAENDLVLVFLNFTGTHKGEFRGMPPTNKKSKHKICRSLSNRERKDCGTLGCSRSIKFAATNGHNSFTSK
jgi:predicted ester cyclase